MKTSFFPAVLLCAFLTGPTLAATDPSAGWSDELAAAQQASRQDTGGRVRAEAILRAVLDASRHGLAAEAPPADASLDAAAAQAAYSALAVLYPQSLAALETRLAESLATAAAKDPALSAGRKWGEHVAQVILAEQGDAVFLNASSFSPDAPPTPAGLTVREAKATVSPPPAPDTHAEQVPMDPGRYRFRVLAGEPGVTGSADGIGAAARFDRPAAIAVDGAGNSYVSERDLCTIRKIAPDGTVTTLAGAAGQKGSQDGAGAAARFNGPLGLAVDGTGNLYVADSGNHTIRKIDPSGMVTTLAGSAGLTGRVDGGRASARFAAPTYLTVDDAGVVFAAESNSSQIRRIAPDGTVSSLQLNLPAYYAVYVSGVPVQGLAVDHTGMLYAIYSDEVFVADVLKLTPAAGGRYESTILTPPPPAPWYSGYPLCLATDDASNLYVKYAVDPIYRFAPDGKAQAFYPAGNSGGYAWNGLAVDRQGTLFAVAPAGYAEKTGVVSIGAFDPAVSGLAITYQPQDYTAEVRSASGAFVSFEVQAAGPSVQAYQWFFNDQPIPGATGNNYGMTNAQTRDAGRYFVVVTDGTGSLASRTATLIVNEVTVSTGAGVTPAVGVSSTSPGPGSTSAGGGSFDQGLALTMLGLLAAAGRRAGGTFNIAAVSTDGRKERR